MLETDSMGSWSASPFRICFHSDGNGPLFCPQKNETRNENDLSRKMIEIFHDFINWRSSRAIMQCVKGKCVSSLLLSPFILCYEAIGLNGSFFWIREMLYFARIGF